MNTSTAKLFLTLAFVALLAGCASEPTEELAAAEAAQSAARDAEANVYVADAFEAAGTKLTDARRAITDGEYDRARELLAEAKTAFDEAAAGVESGRQAATEAAEAAQSQASQALADADAALRKAPRGKGSRLDLQALRSDLEEARATFTAAETDLAAGDAINAKEGFDEAAAQARAVIAAVSA